MQYDPQMMQDILKMIQTPAGQQLITMLQQRGGKGLHDAVQQAAEGNFEEMKRVLSPLLDDPKTKTLLEQLGR